MTLSAVVIAVAIWESPLVPSHVTYCQKEDHEKDVCSDCNVTYFALWQAIKSLDAHNGAIIAVFTIALAGYTFRLVGATNKLVSGAEDTAKRQLRAYLIVETIKTVKTNNEFIVVVRLRNVGHTPAYGFRSVGEISIVDFPIDPRTKERLPMPDKGSRADLGPSAFIEVPMSVPRDSINQEGSLILHEKRVLLVRGCVTYRDTFRGLHTTNYRLFSTGRAWVLGGNFATDEDGNDSD